MPRKEIDYSKTIIYKLCCKNPEIKDIYVGHTTDFTKRKNRHKYCCITENNKSYNYNVYKFIRDNGNWDNWDMVMIEEHSCENKLQAERKEREYIENLNATLNKVIPNRTYEEWYEMNKHELLEKNKIYRSENKKQITDQRKMYYDENKNEILQKIKKYREENKEKRCEKLNEKIYCECGCKISRSGTSKHKKTNKHLELMKLKET